MANKLSKETLQALYETMADAVLEAVEQRDAALILLDEIRSVLAKVKIQKRVPYIRTFFEE